MNQILLTFPVCICVCVCDIYSISRDLLCSSIISIIATLLAANVLPQQVQKCLPSDTASLVRVYTKVLSPQRSNSLR